MNYLPTLNLLHKLANILDKGGHYNEAKVVDKVLKRVAIKQMSLCKVKTEKQLVDNWIAYNRTATKIKKLNNRVARLRDEYEGTLYDRDSG